MVWGHLLLRSPKNQGQGSEVRGEEPGECKGATEIFQGFGANREKGELVSPQVLKMNSQSQMSRHQFKAGPGQA